MPRSVQPVHDSSRSQSNTNNSVASGSTVTPFRTQTRRLDAGNQSAYSSRQMLPSLLPSHSLQSAQLASGPQLQYTPNSNVPGQYMMPSHPPFQNHPQPYAYYEYQPLESGSYLPSQYVQPLPLLEPHPPSSAGSNVFPHYPPPPIPPPAVNNPTPFRNRPYDIQPQPPPLYNTPGYFGLPPHYQPNGYAVFDPNVSGRIRGPMNYSSSRAQPGGPSALRVQSTNSERSSFPSRSNLGTSRNPRPPPTAPRPPERLPMQRSSSTEARVQSNKDMELPQDTTSHAHNRPLARHNYHPNPPPNRSEWVMWMGNVPGNATEDELWQFLERSRGPVSDAGNSSGENHEVLSIFLLSRSNCAFVNYRSEQQLKRAVARYNGRPLRPDHKSPKLVCRVRHKEDDLRAGVGVQRGVGLHARHVKHAMRQKGEEEEDAGTVAVSVGVHPLDSSARSELQTATPTSNETKSPSQTESTGPTQTPSSYASTSSSLLARYFPKRFFILKSLTHDDLDISVERGIWATQKHNEGVLDQAFRTSQEVILIYSVNKSGAFYGYARMASAIFHDTQNVEWAPIVDSSPAELSSRVPAAQSEDGSQTQDFPPEPPMVEGSQIPFMSPTRPSDEARDMDGIAEEQRRSAPPMFRGDSAYSSSANPPSRPVAFEATQHTTRGRRLGKNTVRIIRSGNGHDGSENSRDEETQLQPMPVMEKIQNGTKEEYLEPAPTSTNVPPPVENNEDGNSEAEQQDRSEPGWGKAFKVDWACTERVSFHRTRHLRNPWNHNRQIKVSRDGTEVEPSVGQRLVDEWTTLAGSDTVVNVLEGDGRRHGGGGGGGRRRISRTAVPRPGPSGSSSLGGVKEELS